MTHTGADYTTAPVSKFLHAPRERRGRFDAGGERLALALPN